ncbi:MAG: NUDIX domain-containing protein [archaeon]
MIEMHVVRGIIRHNDKFLMLKKIKDAAPYNKDKWEVPGGKYKENEDPLETLKREIKEETGLKIGEDLVVEKQLQPAQGEAEGVRSYARVFLLKANTDKVTLSDEHSEYAWKTVEEIKKMDLVLFADILFEYLDKINEGIL